MTYKRFEDLPVWQAARRLVRAVYEVTSAGWDRSLRDQIRRAALSTMANVAEGFSRRSDREFLQYLFTAKASAAEVQSHLYVSLDLAHIDASTFHSLFRCTEDFKKQASGLIAYLARERARKRHRP
ncbi:MAG: four helix bundle protein [Armatimonadota bacterium]|nr:four helix bundle protein [Armatimonadota bacterium]MDR7401461.1 four helix bundle protein [Armatimonadota bacterium]MDR7404808.1 four helix bundle protein [Armatimonadota bacterium]MDR7437203.1 four helix bundle protein [Armatimonadota bacterium]MDR7473003.1 four helix bundle protein [Armatimonadota bacterium]